LSRHSQRDNSPHRYDLWVKWLVVAWIVFSCTAALAEPPQFRAEIAAKSEEAAKAWDAGNAARDKSELAAAENAYRKAAELVADVDHPHRRLCSVLASEGRIPEAYPECALALSLAPDSPYDKSAMALLLAQRDGSGDIEKAFELARAAADAAPTDATVIEIQCTVLAHSKDPFALGRCSKHLLELDPNSATGNYYAASIAANNGEYASAAEHLDKARPGIPDDVYQQLHAKIAAHDTGGGSSILLPLVIGALAAGALIGILVLVSRRRG
jgi:tetratricopeptide (TPR) repeat protein